MNIVWALVLTATLFVAWLAQLVGLPGNWLIVVAAALYAWGLPEDSAVAISVHTVVAVLILAIVGEVVEFAAGALGVAKAGGSRRGALLSLVGSAIGAVAGLFIGLPVPIVGSLAAAIVFGGIGALAGAMLGESWKGRDFETSLEIGKAAFVGRLFGTLAKLIVSTLMVILVLGALVLG